MLVQVICIVHKNPITTKGRIWIFGTKAQVNRESDLVRIRNSSETVCLSRLSVSFIRFQKAGYAPDKVE